MSNRKRYLLLLGFCIVGGLLLSTVFSPYTHASLPSYPCLSSTDSSLRIEKYSDGTLDLVNSTDDLLIEQSLNSTWLENFALTHISSGQLYLGIPFIYTLKIPKNVFVIENIDGVTRVFSDSSSLNSSCRYKVSEDKTKSDYVLVQDSNNVYINDWFSTDASKTINNLIKKGDNQTIIFSGNFKLNDSINDCGRSNIFLDGANDTEITCVQSASFNLFNICSSVKNWTITGFFIDASNQDYSAGKNGILCYACNSTIYCNVLTGAAHGCIAVSGMGFNVSENTILYSRDDGIINGNGSYGLIANNSVSNCQHRNGISLVGGAHILVTQNIISNITNQDGIAFENLYGDIPNDYEIIANTINSAPAGIDIYQHSTFGNQGQNLVISGNTILFSNVGISFGSGNNITVKDNQLSGLSTNTYGIVGNSYVSNVYVCNNTVLMYSSNNSRSIYFFNSHADLLINNNNLDGNQAIYVSNIDNVRIVNNTIYGSFNSPSCGITLKSSINSTIQLNRVLSGSNSNGIGISLNSCNQTIVQSNMITCTLNIGISEQMLSILNFFTDNQVAKSCVIPYIFTGTNDTILNNVIYDPLLSQVPTSSASLTYSPVLTNALTPSPSVNRIPTLTYTPTLTPNNDIKISTSNSPFSTLNQINDVTPIRSQDCSNGLIMVITITVFILCISSMLILRFKLKTKNKS